MVATYILVDCRGNRNFTVYRWSPNLFPYKILMYFDFKLNVPERSCNGKRSKASEAIVGVTMDFNRKTSLPRSGVSPKTLRSVDEHVGWGGKPFQIVPACENTYAPLELALHIHPSPAIVCSYAQISSASIVRFVMIIYQPFWVTIDWLSSASLRFIEIHYITMTMILHLWWLTIVPYA